MFTSETFCWDSEYFVILKRMNEKERMKTLSQNEPKYFLYRRRNIDGLPLFVAMLRPECTHRIFIGLFIIQFNALCCV
jgi:hypothetical protein